jgi:uncharacterized membrane protein YeiB
LFAHQCPLLSVIFGWGVAQMWPRSEHAKGRAGDMAPVWR